MITALFCTREREPLAEQVEQGDTRFQFEPVLPAIDIELGVDQVRTLLSCNLFGHFLGSSMASRCEQRTRNRGGSQDSRVRNELAAGVTLKWRILSVLPLWF